MITLTLEFAGLSYLFTEQEQRIRDALQPFPIDVTVVQGGSGIFARTMTLVCHDDMDLNTIFQLGMLVEGARVG